MGIVMVVRCGKSVVAAALVVLLFMIHLPGRPPFPVNDMGEPCGIVLPLASAAGETAFRGGVDDDCTTVLAAGNATVDGSVMLAKNRDLDEFEAQWLYHSARKRYASGARVRLQYIEIPQSEVTWAWVGSKSHELKWGVGMGVNEWGVAVADNDAPTREPLEQRDGLHDNDICRLILERSKTAYEGMTVAGQLLEEYGHSFVGQVYWIADARECWVVEGAGHHWAAVRVSDGVVVRANQFQITTEWDAGSPDLVQYAVEQGWCASADGFSFAECYSTAGYPYGSSQTRYVRARELLQKKVGNITVSDLAAVLSDHYEDTPMYRHPPHSNREYRTICGRYTVSAMVAHLRPWLPRGLQLMWYCMGSPCTSGFTPIYASTSVIPEPYLTGAGARDMSGYDPDSAWWRLKQLQTLVQEDYAGRQPSIRARWDRLFSEERTAAAGLEQSALDMIEEGRYEDAEDAVNGFVKTWLGRASVACAELTEALRQDPAPLDEQRGLHAVLAVVVLTGFIVAFYLRVWKRRAIWHPRSGLSMVTSLRL